MLMKGLGALAPEERKERGKAINAVKQAIDAALTARREALANAELEKKLATEAVDVTLPGRVVPAGGVHPVIRTWMRVEEIFRRSVLMSQTALKSKATGSASRL